MARPEAPLFDAWTPLAFKRVLGNKESPGTNFAVPVWTGEHARRLMAYQVLQAFVDNAARYFLTTPDERIQEQHREYGDAALLRDVVLSALLGEDQHWITERADEFDPNHEERQRPGEDGDNPGTAADTEDTEVDPEVAAAWEFQEWFTEWADLERFPLKAIETERNAVGLGDGVYVLGWNNDKKRVRLRCFDPGFYFPVLNDGNEDDYPEKVHIAWEIPPDKNGPDKDKVIIRRLTWELVERDPFTVPYQDERATKMCVMSDGTFVLDLGAPAHVEDLTGSRVTWADYTDPTSGEVRDWENIDLGIDFIPVIHEPNTVALANHFGRSSIASVMQILDDLANSDTDQQAASATTGNPVITLTGASLGNETTGPHSGEPKRMTYRPGELIETGDGKMGVLDTSKSLDALGSYIERQLKRLHVNARVPGALMGQIEGNEIKSGLHLALTFGPLSSMIKEMRLVRNEKYPLMAKMVWRISTLARGVVEGVPETFHKTRLEFGAFLPSDENGAVTMVKELLSIKPMPAISLETAVQMLINAGLPIEDAVEEVRKIEERAFEQAVLLLEALGSDEEVAEFLGREVPDVPPALPVTGVEPGAGGAPVITPPPGIPVGPPQNGEVVPPTPVPETT